MKEEGFVLKGTVCYSETPKQLQIRENSYLVCIEGLSRGVFTDLPDLYAALPCTDCGSALIIPGLVDLHLHAPQYAFRGLGMDMELLDWLNTHTFPEEAKYLDEEYAKQAYTFFAEDLAKGATTRACIYATVHPHTTGLLMELLDRAGLAAFVGKVNMDQNTPAGLCEESAEKSIQDTIAWVRDTQHKYRHIKPILTPRFAPSCSQELLGRLGGLARECQLPVQSHLSESIGEVAWVRELMPQAAFYGDAYDIFGLFGRGVPTVMAHCVHSGEEEIERIRANDVMIAHCPQSNSNLASGIAPVRTFLDRGIRVGLGSDIAGGHSSSILRAMADSIQVSKLRWRLQEENLPPITLEEAFYMGTKGGGTFWGKAGSFEPGYLFDAVALDDSALRTPRKLTGRERLERAIHMPEACKIIRKFINGQLINL